MRLIYSAIIAVLLSTTSAFALDLQQARSEGLIKENPDGYISAAKSSPEVQELVKDVNEKRKAEYTRISKENGQPVDVVAKLAAEQIKAKAK
ncbi:MAG: hypothetical protein K0R98_1531 [Rickettsiaceae bacterium]|jgi:uncharacterized protein YdbL (DUF1318 family)|nr:hypothetical protein [Rickettsiaceae bacterium]